MEHAVRHHLADLIADEIDLDQVADGKSPSPDALVLAEERRRALKDAIGSLDVADKLLLTLRFKDEIAVDHIAPMVGLRNRFQVHRRLKAVLARVRRVLEDHGFAE